MSPERIFDSVSLVATDDALGEFDVVGHLGSCIRWCL